jgi:hypothetical protein
MLEPDEGKLSSPVLRGGGGGNVASLPDIVRDQVRNREARDMRSRQETNPSGQFHIALGSRPTFRGLDANSFHITEMGNGSPGQMLQTSANQCNDSTLIAAA